MMKNLFITLTLVSTLACSSSTRRTSPPTEDPAKSAETEQLAKRRTNESIGEEEILKPPTVLPKPSATTQIPKAAAHNDNEEYPYFLQFLERFRAIRDVHHQDFADRYLVKITSGQQQPLLNIPFRIYDEAGKTLWEAVSYSNGENVIFPHLMISQAASDNLMVEVVYNGESIRQPLTRQYQRLTEIAVASAKPQSDLSLDILFVLDTTGSMQDEIRQLQDTIVSIHTRIKNLFNFLPIRFGLILYRDRGDEYVVKTFAFTGDLERFQEHLDQVQAGGGGDYPEDLQSALHEALQKLEWNPAAVKLAFVVADAPPHLDYQQDYTYLDAALEANRRGIKIHTIGASGLKIEGEYIFRQISAITYSEFVFLTYGEQGESEGAGVGKVSHHTGDNYESHQLDDLVVNIVRRELSYQLPDAVAARKEIPPQSQENHLRIRMDNLWSQILKQLHESFHGTPVGVLPPFQVTASQVDTLAQYLHQISTISLLESKAIKLVERERLEQIVQEKGLTLAGFVQPQNYSEIWELLGSNVIFFGEVSHAGVDRAVFMRAVRTDNGQIIAAARVRL
jgi:Mg-chelatase subunit ChlD